MHSESFKKYVAATEQARIMSKGSGDLNELDHVAKDLHESGFDEELENIEPRQISEYWVNYRDEVFSMAKRAYSL